MRKKLVIVLIMTLVMTALAITPVSFAHTEDEPLEITLYAGQDIVAGKILVWNDEDNIHIEYETTGDWEIIETHLYIGKTNPNVLTSAPGQFPYSGSNSYVIALDDIDSYHMVKGKMIADETPGVDSDDSVFIATHAKVKLESYSEDCIDVITGLTTTKWTDVDGVTQYDAVACFDHSAWADVPGATWIWRTALTDPLVEYNTVPRYDLVTPKDGWLFTNQFTLPSSAYDITGDIDINSDNSYELSLNNVFIGGEGSMNKDGPDTKGYTTVINYPIYPVAGSNELQIRALNYFNWGNPYSNPAGLAFNADICYKYDYNCQYESAWAGNLEFPGENWATYFTYDIQGWQLVETVTVPALNAPLITATTAFENGELYKLEASGTAWANEYIEFDAEYSWNLGDGGADVGNKATDTWTDGVTGYLSWGTNLLDLKVNGNFINWGTYNTAHKYTYQLTGTGSPVNFQLQINDFYAQNDYGSLTVKIYQWV